ncbi:MAG: hypothetical protein K9J37_04240 [Saprospiraceae bacterium]|nr:hypothetical protein [Saprospiraceae bacterium]MCF8249095.1 hypothetical protein [Saprospiraceae bacterium]MCF8282900.1 hypothetical protein [Bacteroidales bacterium]MCF8311117.1 hypothetical protein [Saprospiraceae bacterium]MCF8440207.1 hypothetical protein [Saprospiraceae bacterium]
MAGCGYAKICQNGEYEKTQEVQNLLSHQLTLLENLNQAILQEAVQGKLVPQDPADELAKTQQLKAHILANQQATEQLLKALLHQAFEVG